MVPWARIHARVVLQERHVHEYVPMPLRYYRTFVDCATNHTVAAAHLIGMGWLSGYCPGSPVFRAFRSDRYFRSSNLSSRRMTGRMNTKRVVSWCWTVRDPNRRLMTGI